MEIPCFLACLLACWTSKLYTLSNKATGSQQRKKERKKERKQISLCMPTPYITTHVATLLEEHITFLFPSSENEGFSQEFQSLLGAQANS
jgi:hypothetical protein